MDEITGQMQRYLLVQIATSVLVGVATWLALLWIGVELLQFGTLAQAAPVGAVALLITSLEGYVLTPWSTGRASRMNPVAVFVGVLFWGWLWGVRGLLLGE